eukprot:scaffold13255_cov128-Isochrysis_galbana.AAC.8
MEGLRQPVHSLPYEAQRPAAAPTPVDMRRRASAMCGSFKKIDAHPSTPALARIPPHTHTPAPAPGGWTYGHATCRGAQRKPERLCFGSPSRAR